MGMLDILGILFGAAAAILILLLTGVYILHAIKLKKEAQAVQPPGKMVDVNGLQMHVFTAGSGKETLVFLAGHGTISPVSDFYPVWSRLMDEYSIAVVERFGYGWSDTSNVPRDITTILENTRKALDLAGVPGPYVLVPHSMAGLEALLWVQKYPEEVKAIIGLDPTTPASIQAISRPNPLSLYVMYLVSRIGLTRFIPESELGAHLPLMKTDELNHEEKRQLQSILYRSAFSRDMMREIKYLAGNARSVADNKTPFATPMLFFISNEQEANAKGWKRIAIDYLARLENGKGIELDTGHYLHHEKAAIITQEAKRFIEESLAVSI